MTASERRTKTLDQIVDYGEVVAQLDLFGLNPEVGVNKDTARPLARAMVSFVEDLPCQIETWIAGRQDETFDPVLIDGVQAMGGNFSFNAVDVNKKVGPRYFSLSQLGRGVVTFLLKGIRMTQLNDQGDEVMWEITKSDTFEKV